jgi:hypothetical protein
MYLPPELQYMIISFVPHSDFITVSKDWSKEIKSIQKKSVNIIGEWYKSKRVRDHYSTVYEMIRFFVIHYPTEFFLMHPESTVLRLGLNESIVTVIPTLANRKRSDVRDWMMNMPINLDDWLSVGYFYTRENIF